METPTMELTSYGDGSGDGYGSGSGSGSGSGYGSGSSYGSGSGDGYGSGSGSGYGYGSGSSYGSGSGDGYGEKKYLEALLETVTTIPHTILAFWKSTTDGKPCNGGEGLPAVEGKTEEVNGPLEICTSHALHGTLSPQNWKGENWWIVALHEPVIRQGDKLASLKRTYVKHLGKCPF